MQNITVIEHVGPAMVELDLCCAERRLIDPDQALAALPGAISGPDNRRKFAMSLPVSPLRGVLRLLPDRVHAELLSRFFNHLLQGQYAADQLRELDGKRLAMHVTDAGTDISFRVQGGCLYGDDAMPWDVCIRGRTLDFLHLAAGIEDADTLFFKRHLALEGETETGLYLKNFLDALDFDWACHLEEVMGQNLGRRVYRVLQRSGLPVRVQKLVRASLPEDAAPTHLP